MTTAIALSTAQIDAAMTEKLKMIKALKDDVKSLKAARITAFFNERLTVSLSQESIWSSILKFTRNLSGALNIEVDSAFASEVRTGDKSLLINAFSICLPKIFSGKTFYTNAVRTGHHPDSVYWVVEFNDNSLIVLHGDLDSEGLYFKALIENHLKKVKTVHLVTIHDAVIY